MAKKTAAQAKSKKKAASAKNKKKAGTANPPRRKTAAGTKPGDRTAVEKRMRKLADEIRKHQYLYYVKNKPEIPDRDFDHILVELQQLEADHPDLADPDSPSRIVGSDLDSEFPKFTHTIPVLSLSNTYSTEEALEWAEKIADAHTSDIGVQWKVDGASLVVYYEDGRLVRAVTRGTGQVGDEVTNNALTIRNIPHQLREKVTVAVRGEVYMTFADFEEFNEALGWIYANPRNLAAGTLKHKKSSEVAKRPLRWMPFDGHLPATVMKNRKIRRDRDILKYLEKLGLPVSADNKFVKPSQLRKTITEFAAQKDGVPMPVDGLVLKVDDLEVRERLGFTANNPRWATSLKFEPEIGETAVREIQVQTGRTGRVTPRAKLDPLKLAGTTVTYATLHNADYVEKLGVRIGSRVKVSKRGEIIPAVEEVVDPGDGPAYKFPTKCPTCSTKLNRDEDAVDWMCPNPECDAKMLNRLIFFAGRKQMDIAGLGEKVVTILYEKGFIRRIPDIYQLHKQREQLEELEGFGKKSVQVLLDGIEASKQREFRYVLPALGLREVGTHVTGILLTEGYDSVEKIIKLAKSKDGEEILKNMDGIGPRIVEAVTEQFRDKQVQQLIKDLKKAGLTLAAPERAAGTDLPQIFEGQSWCVTGSFTNFRPRDLAMEEVRNRGGRIVTGVSSKTSHLLAGEGAGSKLEKAEKLGVTVVSEDEFLKMLSE